MSAKNVQRLAEMLNLTVLAKGGLFPAPSAVGSLQGFPVLACWTKVKNVSCVAFLVRFKKGSIRATGAELTERISASPDLLAAISKTKLGAAEKKSIVIGPDFIRFDLSWSLRAPTGETGAAVLRALVSIVAGVAQPIGAACESCSGGHAELYCVDGAPTVICAACREREQEEGRRRTEGYMARPANLLLGTAAGLAACVVMALLWGGVAFALERIFLYGAILIGVAVAWSVNRGMGKVTIYGRALAITLTLGAVLLGDYVFILLSTARELGTSLSMEMARIVAGEFAALEFSSGSSGWLSLLFAVVGAGYVLWTNRPPVLTRTMVPVSAS